MAPETMLCGPGGIFATNDPQPLAIADEDRRFTFLTNGEVQQPSFYVDLHAWMSVPGNVGAFRRDLEAVDLKGFNAYASLSTRLKDMIIADFEIGARRGGRCRRRAGLAGGGFSIRQVCEAVQAMAQRDLGRARPAAQLATHRPQHRRARVSRGRHSAERPQLAAGVRRAADADVRAHGQGGEAVHGGNALLASGAAKREPEGARRSEAANGKLPDPPAGRTGSRGSVAGHTTKSRFRGTLYLIMGCRLYLRSGGVSRLSAGVALSQAIAATATPPTTSPATCSSFCFYFQISITVVV